MTPDFQLFVDTGGTFTDALALTPKGETLRAKVLSSGALRGVVKKVIDARTFEVSLAWSTSADILKGGFFNQLSGGRAPVRIARFDPEKRVIELAEEPAFDVHAGSSFEVQRGEEAPILAARLLTGTPADAPLPRLSMRLGTTLATNALLTRSGAPTALFITQGFKDLLEIGTQQRPDLFALKIEKPALVHECVVEASERLAADGSVLLPLRTETLDEEVGRLLDRGIRTAAVALLHADRNPTHEQALAAYLKRAGFARVSCSSDLAQAIRILPRAATAVADAYLSPVVEDYLERIHEALGGGRLLVMSSAGGLAGRTGSRPKDLLLSGPAGGVVGAARAGRRSGFDGVISFDMGGTSTDVARFDGAYDYVFEHRVGDAFLFAPALSIETVAAGGGSICRFDGTALSVGPESAGASPGPACYGVGGPLTLTDVNLLLGRLDENRFGIPVQIEPAKERLSEVMDRLAEYTKERPPIEQVLEGFLAIANERMADAIRRISLRRGYDPADYALVTFGGAGAQHACAVAARLGVRAVAVPADAGLLSAWGLGAAVVERFAEEQVLKRLEEVEAKVPALLDKLASRAKEALAQEGVPKEEATIRRRIAEMRFKGQETALQVEIEDPGALQEAFAKRYEDVYGHKPGERDVELVSLRVAASSRELDEEQSEDRPGQDEAKPLGARRSWFEGRWQKVPVFERSKLSAGNFIEGPALVFEEHSATVVEPGWRLHVDPAGSLIMEASESDTSETKDARPEAVQVELFSHRFETIAREMGEALRRTAVSTNVKERLDFSCALLDARGELVVNAPHIPVHLGSMGLCVRAMANVLPMNKGDMAVTNHPSFGGSHLPDLTVAAPVHDDGGTLLGYVAARAHHAEIGGTRPGSMPPDAKRLAEEGVVIQPVLAVKGGEGRWSDVADILWKAPWPTRALQDNLADLQAAAAACHRGGEGLRALAKEHGVDVVSRYMAALKSRAARRMREALGRIPDGVYEAEEFLDDGTPLRVKVSIKGERAVFDFAGSADVHSGNLNATPAIVYSCVIYVLRLLVREELPLNEGLLEPVEIKIPEGILNPPFPEDPMRAPSIVGGNVETSQRIVDTLIKALGLCAAGQGTMNNVLFGDEEFSYYETVCGGCGAGPDFDGASAVHCHMTNTRITDPEVLELRCPVRLERFEVRRGSGGAGRFQGGDGARREITFLKPLELSVLTQRRKEGPFGMEGGGRGKPGLQKIIRADGTVKILGAVDSCRVEANDRLVLETPGGGGYGKN